MSGLLLSRPRPRGPRVHSIISMPPEVWAFELTYLRTPPTDEGYQKAIRAIAQTVAQSYSPRRQDIVYNQLRSLERWSPPRPSKGAPKGPRDYPDNETLVQMVIDIKRRFVKKGIRPTQSRVAMYLMELHEEQAKMLDEGSSKNLQRQRQSVVRHLQRLCKGVGWDKLL
jgi:hypothetical protein